MFQNYLMVALRNLTKHKLYSAINMVGLAVGLAASILILLFVRNETTYDRFFTDSDRLYQMAVEGHIPGRPSQWIANTSLPMGPALQQSFPEIEAHTRLVRQNITIQRGDVQFNEEARLVDPNFFQLFDFPFIAGNRETALSDPSAIVLTEEVARKYFGDADPLGQTLRIGGEHSLRVTGIMRDLPPNTHFSLGILIPMNSVAARNLRQLEQNWGALCCYLYVRVKPDTDVARINGQLGEWIRKAAPTLETPQGPVAIGEFFGPRLRAVADIHTEPMLADAVPGISMTEIYTFSGIAVLVLVIAAINFMNLATARATQRAREVSVRKVVGASRGQIVLQFIGESVLMTLLSLFLAAALVELALPWYNDFLGKELSFDYAADPSLLLLLLGLTLLVGMAGGTYPAFFLSGFNPARVLKGASSGVGGGSGRLRMVLVIVQFAISIGLMVATAVVYGQLRYAQNKNLGFDKDNLVVIQGFISGPIRDKRETFQTALKSDPRIVGAVGTTFIPGDGGERNTNIRRPGEGAATNIVMRVDAVDYGFMSIMGMHIIAGRDFDRTRGTDGLVRPDWQIRNEDPPAGQGNFVIPGATILNRAAVRRLGFDSPEAAVGQIVEAAENPNSSLRLTIVGVVEDFHFRSVHDEIAPAFFIVDPSALNSMIVRVKAGDVAGALGHIDRTWREIVPERPIRRAFLDDNLQALYEREQKMSLIFAAFSGLAILIACLGLFGLAAFTAERRTKEIGLRKVLGAGVPDIVRLLVWQFSKPVLIANLIAWPVAWIGMNEWLKGFSYRIDLSPAIFLAAGGAALLIAWLTVGLHATRIAQAKPVRALRYE